MFDLLLGAAGSWDDSAESILTSSLPESTCSAVERRRSTSVGFSSRLRMGSAKVNVSSTMPRRLAKASARRMFRPKPESVPAAEANRPGRSAAARVNCQAASSGGHRRRRRACGRWPPACRARRFRLRRGCADSAWGSLRGNAACWGRAAGALDAVGFERARELVIDAPGRAARAARRARASWPWG